MEINNETGHSELIWMELNETAMAQWAMGRFGAAAEKWDEALCIARQFKQDDPRLASSLSNAGIAHRSRGEFTEAEQYYHQALAGWKAASAWLNEMQLGGRALSSLFHLRMERKHQKQYDRNAIKHYEKLLPAGQAGTRNNLAELYQTTKRLAEAQQLYQEALVERTNSIDDQEIGVAVIRKNIAGLARPDERSVAQKDSGAINDIFSAQASRRRWIIDQPAEFTDEGRLMAALLLTHVVDHSKL